MINLKKTKSEKSELLFYKKKCDTIFGLENQNYIFIEQIDLSLFFRSFSALFGANRSFLKERCPTLKKRRKKGTSFTQGVLIPIMICNSSCLLKQVTFRVKNQGVN